MRYFLVTLFLIIACTIPTSSQNLFFEAKSGYGLNSYKNRPNYNNSPEKNNSVGYVPLNLSLGGGFKHFQIGFDHKFSILPVSFYYNDPFTNEKRLKEETRNSYIGGFLRLNTSEKPEKNAGFIIKVGAGLLNAKKVVYNFPSETKHEQEKYEPTLQYIGCMGVNIPVRKYVQIFLGVGYREAKMERKFDGITLEKFKRNRWIANLGASFNLNFQDKKEND